MKVSRIPPHVVMDSSKEVIFYVSSKSNQVENINAWMKELNLSDYNGMVIKSKCIFNRFKKQDC